MLLAAFQALVEHVPSRLTVIGADPEDLSRLDLRPRRALTHRRARQGVRLGPLAPPRRRRPALRALPGRRELRHGPDRGVRRGHARDRLGDRRLQGRRHRRCRRRPGAARRPAGAWPRSCSCSRTSPSDSLRWARRAAAAPSAMPGRAIADQVKKVYEWVTEPAPAPLSQAESAARRTGLVRIDGGPRRPAKRLPSLEPAPTTRWRPWPTRRPQGRSRRRGSPRPASHRARRTPDRRRPAWPPTSSTRTSSGC